MALIKDLSNKEQQKRFKSMTSSERKALILKTMNALVIEVGSGISNKKYDC
tara:strand:+ start:2666 stop:2818 length:153 start_codon:yes stop_codon:yes gene_type:complete